MAVPDHAQQSAGLGLPLLVLLGHIGVPTGDARPGLAFERQVEAEADFFCHAGGFRQGKKKAPGGAVDQAQRARTALAVFS